MGLWGMSACLGSSFGALGFSMLMEVFGREVPRALGLHMVDGAYHVLGYSATGAAAAAGYLYSGYITKQIRTRDAYINPQDPDAPDEDPAAVLAPPGVRPGGLALDAA
eukprot:gb/GFBE01018885.1/.p1 GENE.gb/GFBE01018885.1/~~gb/GFBE01018885.1/.p1  ORF type:complete len:108 (+),score=16.35 gb/GFBE01018885.1/:1-324(+)